MPSTARRVRVIGAALGAMVIAACAFDAVDNEGKRCDESCGALACVDHVCRRTPAVAAEAGTADGPVAPVDSASEAPVADAGVEAGPPNLLINGTFETGCGPWSANNASVVAGGRSGKACRVCGTTPPGNVSLDLLESGPKDVTAGQTYLVTYWVKADPVKGPASVFAAIRAVDYPFDIVQRVDTPSLVPTDEWQSIDVGITLDQPANYLNTYLAGTNTSPEECFLVDDVTMTLAP